MMSAMAYDEELAGRVRAALADRTDVEEKKMFGGLSFMVAGQMCCGVLKGDLVVRIEPAEFDTLVAQPHVRPFDFTGRPMQGMVYVDNGALADPDRSRVKEERFLPQREHSQKKIVRKDAAPPRHGPKAADIVSEGEQRIRVVTEREVLPLRVRRIVCAQRNRRR